MNNGLVMHFMHFPNELRGFDQVPKAEGEKVPKHEIELGENVIDKISAEDFTPKISR